STGDAIPFFQRAIQLDPRYARAHALLAYCFAWRALFIDPANAGVWVAKAEEAANTADRLGGALAETHIVRSELLFSEHRGWRIDDAIRELKTAIALDPNVGQVELGILFAHLGSKEQARQHLEQALVIDPLGAVPKSRYVEFFCSMGEYEEALKASRRFYNRDGPIEALLGLGYITQAKPLIKDALRTSSAPRVLANKALLLAMEGRFVEAERLIPRIARGRLDRGYHHAALSVAGVFGLQGKAADALKWLRISASTGMPNHLLFSRDPSLDRIRSSPEFQQFMAGIKRTWE
ncbi:MAG: hypothetical protein ABI822_12215, partial [Bryobacteraceae bacterium]